MATDRVLLSPLSLSIYQTYKSSIINDNRAASDTSIYRSGAKYCTIVQHLVFVFAIFKVLESPIHVGNELETSNCNLRHNEPCKNIIEHRYMCWCNT
jgi:hypothetical protein